MRISKVVAGLKSISRDSRHDPTEKVDVESLLNESVAMCLEKFSSHGVSIQIAPFSSMTFFCRPTEISQILINLLNNAFDAVENQPEKWIRLSACADQINKTVEISVSDSGTGVPLNLRDKIMQPFFTTKDMGKGTGLGLSISRGLAQAQGGDLFFDKASAHTRFVIRLPL